jgi:excisionase family DNA binding protein
VGLFKPLQFFCAPVNWGRKNEKNNTMEQNMTKDTDMRLMSIPEACKRLGIGHWSVYRQINRNALKSVKIGKRRLISVRALNQFIASLEQ